MPILTILFFLLRFSVFHRASGIRPVQTVTHLPGSAFLLLVPLARLSGPTIESLALCGFGDRSFFPLFVCAFI